MKANDNSTNSDGSGLSNKVSSERDNIYSNPLGDVANFRFDDDVVKVFPDMIQRSVPGYSTIIAMTGVLAGRYASPNSVCYDLGSSLGASTLSMRAELESKNRADYKIVAVDNSAAMVQRCRELLVLTSSSVEIDLRCEDLRDVDIDNASVVVMNFTLQFIPREQRSDIIQKIFDGMNVGGIMILSEKIIFSDEHLQILNTDLHHAFKRSNGYSDMEVSQKRSALEHVLLPETLGSHQQRLFDAGFSSCDVWFQCFNFASIVAVK